MKTINKILLSVIVLLIVGCANVSSLEKMKLNDEEMRLAERDIKKFETTFQAYREGSSGANGGNTGGGCGCN